MAVTIQMIETKEFKLVQGRGYDPEEVDEFLDAIMDEFENMQREIQRLRTESRQRPAAPAIPAAPQSDASTEAASRMLANAQRVSDETIEDARRQAEVIVADAKGQADSLVSDARMEAGRLTDSLDTLRTAANDYRARFKRLVDDQMHLINAEKELFE